MDCAVAVIKARIVVRRYRTAVPEILLMGQEGDCPQIRVAARIFREKQVSVLRRGDAGVQNVPNPVQRNPVPEQIRHRADENILRLPNFGGFVETPAAERRRKAEGEVVAARVRIKFVQRARVMGVETPPAPAHLFPEAPFIRTGFVRETGCNVRRIAVGAMMITSCDGIPCAATPINFRSVHASRPPF